MVIRLVLGTLVLIGVFTGARPAKAASRNFGINSFERIRVEGPFNVRLKNGVAPFATASGAPAAIDRVAIEIMGRTLVVRTNPSWGGYPGKDPGPVEISVGTHELSSAWLNGSGSLQIDKVDGLVFELAVQGSGSARIAAADVDKLTVAIAGSASASVAGRADRLSVSLRGISSLDASGLATKDADLTASGPSTIKASVANAAKILASGVATVTLTGDPACAATVSGSASVSGCQSAQ